ncbi:hypothetical protein PIB30_044170 [Stylosanthes scabra]|uniref:Transposase (putative) gypsy type domain-containing protein n=1 Tax=Stylosanthes scabra TaxID=79078 RepID=A0ABU6XDI3_9FABA|nr:hypothetical protein [Stylosanthes scabra]
MINRIAQGHRKEILFGNKYAAKALKKANSGAQSLKMAGVDLQGHSDPQVLKVGLVALKLLGFDGIKSLQSWLNKRNLPKQRRVLKPKIVDGDVYEWVSDSVLEVPSKVCHKGEDADWFFMYTCVLVEIGVRFPFTEFECAVLRQLNCAPTQIHPNSWDFIRAFEVLMEYLQEQPLLALLFYLFQAKGVDREIWVALSSHQGRTVFSLFNPSYRDFKNFYIRVRSSDDAFPFFLDEKLSTRFPLYWNEKPVKCLGVEELCERDACRAERELSSSQVVKVEKGSEVSKPSEKRKPISLKRMRTEETSGKKVIDLTEGKCCGRDVVLEKVVEFTKSQQGLHGFDEAEADEHFQSKVDVDLLKRNGKVASARYMQVQVARLMCISRGLELQALEEENSQRSKKVDSLELEKKLLIATEHVVFKEKENGLLKEENDELRVKITKLSKDKKDLESRVVEVCGERKEAEVSKKAHGFEMFAAA